MTLHRMLHFKSNRCCSFAAIRVTHSIKTSNRFVCCMLGCPVRGGIRCDNFSGTVSCGPAEDHNVKKRVRAEAIRSMNRNTGCLTNCHKTGHNCIFIILGWSQHFTMIVGWYTTHIIMDRWQNWNGFARHINTTENLCCFGNARKPRMKCCRINVLKMQHYMVLVRPDAAPLVNLNRHRPTYHITAC